MVDEIIKTRTIWAKKATKEIFYKDGSRGIQYHETEVIRVWPDGSAVLNTGGWYTPTTKNRINQHLTVGGIFQKGGLWFFYNGQDFKKAYPFFEGMKVKDGQVLNGSAKVLAQLEKKEDKNKALKAKIKKFVAKIDKMSKEELRPSSGDCWNCLMFEASGMGDNAHLEQHIKEGYMHGSLIRLGLINSGYAHPEYVIGLDCRDSIKRAVYRFLIERLCETKPIRRG